MECLISVDSDLERLDVVPAAQSSCCNKCKKSTSELTEPLKRCARCYEARYCSRDCQRADWKDHKKTCGRGQKTNDNESDWADGKSKLDEESEGAHSQMNSMLSILAQTGQGGISNDFGAISNGNYFDGLSRQEAYRQIIDSYRLRVEDDYAFRGDHRGIYNEAPPLPDFRRYLDKAEKRAGVLPSWWNKQTRAECEERGMSKAEKWAQLQFAVEKHDIQEHYKDNMMPMKLRMIAEKVEGFNVMGHGF